MSPTYTSIFVKLLNIAALLCLMAAFVCFTSPNTSRNISVVLMWSTACNNNVVVDLAKELAKDVPSKGNYLDDYVEYCKLSGVIQLPSTYFNVYSSKEGENKPNVLRIANCAIDNSNWRCLLLASCTVGSTIDSIVTHNLSLNPQHITDLIAAVEKIGQLTSLILEHISMNEVFFSTERSEEVPYNYRDETIALQDSLLGLFSNNNFQIQYLSLKGNKLGDNFVTKLQPLLVSNLAIYSLNLCDNFLTKTGVLALFTALRLNPYIKSLSIAKNLLDYTAGTGESSELVSSLAMLYTGSIASTDDENHFKNIAKLITDRNKAIKEVNKKRKKANQNEFAELATPDNRVFKVDGSNVLVNKGVDNIDLSYTKFVSNKDAIMELLDTFEKKASTVTSVVGSMNLLFCVKGSTVDQTIVDKINSIQDIQGPTITLITE